MGVRRGHIPHSSVHSWPAQAGRLEPPAADRQPSLRLAASEYRVNISLKDPDVRLFCVQVQGFPDRGCAIGAGELGVMEVSSASRSPPHSGQLCVSLIVVLAQFQ